MLINVVLLVVYARLMNFISIFTFFYALTLSSTLVFWPFLSLFNSYILNIFLNLVLGAKSRTLDQNISTKKSFLTTTSSCIFWAWKCISSPDFEFALMQVRILFMNSDPGALLQSLGPYITRAAVQLFCAIIHEGIKFMFLNFLFCICAPWRLVCCRHCRFKMCWKYASKITAEQTSTQKLRANVKHPL